MQMVATSLDRPEESAHLLKNERAHRIGKLNVAVAVLTRDRPAMLARCLHSLAELRVPEDTKVSYIVVENGDSGQAQDVTDEFAGGLKDTEVMFRHVPKPSIPAARNEALRAAALHGADLIAFIDDDECAEPEWLRSMIDRFRDSNLELIGGPVSPRFDPHDGSYWMRRAEDGLRSYYENRSRRAQQQLENGQQRRIMIVTNNWLGDMRLFTERGLKFNEDLAASGGSDMRYYRDCRAAGVHSGWVPKAEVIETVSPDRLSIAYQFRRAIHQSRMTFRIKAADRGPRRATLRNLPIIAVRTLLLPLHVPLLVVSGGKSVIYSARSLGWICGQVSAMCGAQSDLYRKTTGY
jgi:succinoglycan biosynthesis protein ExoM